MQESFEQAISTPMSQSALPNGKPSVSFCMIVKNEEQNLERCLNSVCDQVDEIVVVDTGSTDRTIEIAQRYGARVDYFEWCDDFAAARNVAIALTTGDWVLTLDADEELALETPHWREQLLTPEVLAYWVPIIDIHQDVASLYAPRLFRNVPTLRYAEPYHETLKYQGINAAENVVLHQSCVRIIHYGYSDDLLVTKNLQRDIPMLERIRQEHGLSVWLLGTLADNYLRIGQLENARQCWAEAFDRILPNLLSGELPSERMRLPAIMLTVGLDLVLEQQDYDTASLICRRGLEWFPTYPPLHYLSGLLLSELGFPLGAIAYFDACLTLGQTKTFSLQESFDQQFMTVFPAYQMGLAYQRLNRLADAEVAFRQVLEFEPNHDGAIAALQHLTPLD